MRDFRFWCRLALFLVSCLALLAFLLSGGSVAQARTFSLATQSGGPSGKSIDWTHPVHLQPVHTHNGQQSALSSDTVPFFMSSLQVAQGLAARPDANFPSNCYANYAYYVIVGGRTSWSAQVGNQEAQVWYMWCPRWQGDSVGINWSYGKIYQLAGCATIYVGGPIGDEVGGAFILEQTSWPSWADDGEPVTGYYTCAGTSNSLVWDDSLTLPGDGLYKVLMEDSQVEASSPCYC